MTNFEKRFVNGSQCQFQRSGDNWSQQQELHDSASGTDFASSVALDLDTLVIGVPSSDAAFVYARDTHGWGNEIETGLRESLLNFQKD